MNKDESETTPLNATNLNKIDSAVDTIDDRVITLDTTKATKAENLENLNGVTYDSTTGTFTFTWVNGDTLVADLNIEKIPVSFSMSADGIITMTTTDGSTYTADIGSLIKEYEFEDSSDIDFTTTTDGTAHTVSATIKNGAVTEAKLQPDFLANCRLAAAEAEAGATEATAGGLTAEGFAKGTQNGEPVGSTSPYYHNNAKYYSEQTNPEAFANMTDVNFTNLQNGQVPVYNSTTEKWENANGGTGGGSWGSITGDIEDQTDLQNALDSKLPTNNPIFTGELKAEEAHDPHNIQYNHVSIKNNSVYLMSSIYKGTMPQIRQYTGTCTIDGQGIDVGFGITTGHHTKITEEGLDCYGEVKDGSGNILSNKQDKLPTTVNDRYLHANASTGALEWAEAAKDTFMTETLTAGTTAVTFTSELFTETACVDIYTDKPDLEYESQSLSGTTLTVTFKAQTTDTAVKIRISNS